MEETTIIDIEEGKSSNSKDMFVCEICTDTKTISDAFCISGCSHAYCSDCIAMYIGSKLEDNITNIVCPVPRCSGSLDVEFCRSILPDGVFERWGDALCETSIDVTEIVTKTECPSCNRMFCAQCKVPWHQGIKCSEFEKLNADEREKEDVMLMNLAKNMAWRRCPKCKFYVAKSTGCDSMICRFLSI
ncbi:putative E3 ubiquitin-protein ligase RNF144A-like [Trifolium medium]|uniref:RBR-type E3 ubiquitin transferase n=1 Tax=Trifolium medium TaxID=97028 RepID=A0A392MML2_9FABA|nr:putative E3 ubiquitin-protein ligase RNF144A-like [Trifolium medium]